MMPTTSNRVSLLITVDNEHGNKLTEVVNRLKAAGMSVDSVMESLGTITGFIELERLPLISQVEGVLHVETARAFQLAPPESDIQ